MKRCALCKTEKPREAFYVSRQRQGGLQSRCIECLKARKRGRSKAERRDAALDGFRVRFWANVPCRDPHKCWEWAGYRMSTGYGAISRADRHTMVLAHRASWELLRGDPGDLHVLHKCDNRPCVNPDHLFLGTHQDNMADMCAKGRGSAPPVRRGSANNKARLTEEQVRAIREEYATGGVSMRQLAQRYGVTFTPIQMLITGKTWRHV